MAAASTAAAVLVVELAIRAWVPVRNVGPTFTRYDSAIGKRLKASFTCTRITPEFTMKLSTNSLGWRGGEYESRPAGSIVCLGDSFTLGYGVDDGCEYPRILQRELDEALGQRSPCVVNLGIGGSGSGRWIKLIERGEVEAFDPSLVVLQVCSNDWDENRSEGLFALRPEAGLVEFDVPAPRWTRRVQELIESIPLADRTWTVGLLRQAFVSTPNAVELERTDTAESFAGEDDLTLALITAAVERCKARGWPVLLLSADLEGVALERLRRLASELDIHLIVGPTPNQRRDLYFRVDRHWNAQGHQEIASQLAEHVVGWRDQGFDGLDAGR